jgi:hypothetical protein
MSRFTRGRRRTSVLFGFGLAALAFGVSVGLAKSGPGQVKVNLYSPDNPPFCPVSTDTHVAGTAKVIREKGVITVRVHLHNAVPGKYIIELGVPNPLSITGCDLYGPFSIKTFHVDSSGDGQGAGSFVGMTKQTFVVGAFHVKAFAAYVSPLFKLGSS